MSYVRYTKTNTPLLQYREYKHIEFLEHAADAKQPIVTVNKNSMTYPSYRIAYDLEQIGALKTTEMNKPDGQVGRVKLGYVITDDGRQLLELLHNFQNGGLNRNQDCELLVAYWQAYNPDRLLQHYANLAIAGDGEAVEWLDQYRDEHGFEVPMVQAVVDAMASVDKMMVVKNTDRQANPHCLNEVKGGSIQGRISGWSAYCRDKINEQDNGKPRFDNDTDLLEYLLTVAYVVTLNNKV